jgi:multimeric flavodoxin WrbA
MVKILVLMGSPRKGGNTDILLDEFIKGVNKTKNSVDKLYVYELKINPCVDCRTCKTEAHACKIKDDMQKVYPLLDAADLIVFATPVYWWGPSAPMKLLIDRLRPFGFGNRKLKGKKAVLIAPSGDVPESVEVIVQQFEKIFRLLGLNFIDKILVQAYNKGDVKQNQSVLKKAFEMGAGL